MKALRTSDAREIGQLSPASYDPLSHYFKQVSGIFAPCVAIWLSALK
jgi:hypothetical protein